MEGKQETGLIYTIYISITFPPEKTIINKFN